MCRGRCDVPPWPVSRSLSLTSGGGCISTNRLGSLDESFRAGSGVGDAPNAHPATTRGLLAPSLAAPPLKERGLLFLRDLAALRAVYLPLTQLHPGSLSRSKVS